MNSLMESMVTVQPHALDNHVPALCGPLQAGHFIPFRHESADAPCVRGMRNVGCMAWTLHTACCQKELLHHASCCIIQADALVLL